MKNEKIFTKRFIWFNIIYLLIIFVYCYFCLPFYNFGSVSFYFFLAIIIGYVLSIIEVLIYNKRKLKEDNKTCYKVHHFNKFNGKIEAYAVSKEEYYSKKYYVRKGLLIVFSSFIALVVLLTIIGSELFNAKRYAKQLEIRQAETEEFNTSFDYESGDVLLPMIDKELAFKLAQAKLEQYGSQYKIDSDIFTTISVERNGKMELIRVTPLEYGNPFIALSRGNKGTIGYIEVNVVTKEANLVKFDENNGLKYMPSGLFKYDLDRYIRSKYPSCIYSQKYFEIDNDGNPYWVIPTIKKEIGIISGPTTKGVIIVNPITGETNYYKNLGDEPSWTQRCIDEGIIESQASNALQYSNGWFNRYFAKKQVFLLSDGYNYLMKNGDTYFVSCITSPSESDQTSIGFILINLKTKEAVKYLSGGITEMRAREIAMYDERVKAQALDATWPILMSYHGVPTYFVVLKNDVQAQKVVFINVVDGLSVAIGDNIESAKAQYDTLIDNKNSGNQDILEYTGRVTAIRDTGNTIEFMLEGKEDIYFSVDVKISLDARFLKVGDNIKVTYKEYKAYSQVLTLEKIE